MFRNSLVWVAIGLCLIATATLLAGCGGFIDTPITPGGR